MFLRMLIHSLRMASDIQNNAKYKISNVWSLIYIYNGNMLKIGKYDIETVKVVLLNFNQTLANIIICAANYWK